MTLSRHHRYALGTVSGALGLCLSATTVTAQPVRPLLLRAQSREAETDAALQSHLQLATTRRAMVARIDVAAFEEYRLELSLFPTLRLEAIRTPVDFVGTRYRAWFGRLADNQGSAVFVINGNRVSGKINSSRGTFEVFPLSGGHCVIVEHDPGAFPGCGAIRPASPRRPLRPFRARLSPPIDTADTEGGAMTGDSPAGTGDAGDSLPDHLVRVLVAYTVGARTKTQVSLGRTMQEHVDLAIAESNQGYANSGVTMRVELACLYQTDFAETTSIENDVVDFRNDGDGKGDEVHQFRADYDADMCCLLTDGRDYSWCGWSYGFDYTDRENMFQATSYACATSNLSFAHEFGHTQGCRHDSDPGMVPFAYGHGYRNAYHWRTIMALAGYTSAPRLNYWSNPEINSPVYPFTPMGTPVDDGEFANDCRTTLNVTSDTVINHELTPAQSTAPTDDHFGADEFAEKVVSDALTVGVFTAGTGSIVRFRAGSSIRLQSGFQAEPGSQFRASLADPLGDPLPGLDLSIATEDHDATLDSSQASP